MKIFAITSFLLASLVQASIYEELDGTSSHINGPNCWNGALYAAGVVEHKRMFSPGEWLYLLEKNCSIVDRPQRGDVGRIFLDGGDEVHGFIHLDDETIFAKHGERTEHGYQIMSYEKMLNDYGRTRQCRTSRDFSPECYHDVIYYRCEGKRDLPPELVRLDELFEELTFSDETRWRFGMSCEDQTHLNRERIATELISALEEIDENLEAQIDRDYFRHMLVSLADQTHRTRVSNRNFTCRPRELRDNHDQLFQALRVQLRDRIEKLSASTLAVFRIGEGELGSCTGFHSRGQNLAETAAHCLKNTPLSILSEEPVVLPIDQQWLEVGPLGVYDRGFFNSDSLQSSDYSFDLNELSALADFTIIGFPEFRRDRSPTIFLCSKVERERGLNRYAIERDLGSVHLECPYYLDETGTPQDASELRHREVRGLSGGAVVSEGEVVGVAYHFDDSELIYKVQQPTANGAPMVSPQVWQRFRLARSIFEEVKLPNAVNIAIDFLLLTNGIALSERDQMEIVVDSENLILRSEQVNLSVPLSRVSWTLRTYFQ